MSKKTETLALRLAKILHRLNLGERLSTQELADEFDTDIRTIQRDMARLSFLEWEESGNGYYKIDRTKLDILTQEEIQRFAHFASVSDLFPQIDKEFFQRKLTQSVAVKGLQYEDVSQLQKEFNQLKQAIEQHQFVHFKYQKHQDAEGKFRKIAPYSLINKNGIWYLVGVENEKPKTFCFTKIKDIKTLENTFEPNQQFIEEFTHNDSLYFGEQISEVLIQVSEFAAPYFLRRNLLPNQSLVHKLENGEILLSCKKVNELDVLPLVQYWIPHLTIISPQPLQQRMLDKLENYLESFNSLSKTKN